MTSQYPIMTSQYTMMTKQKYFIYIFTFRPFAMRLEIELRCILFPLIILEMFLQLDCSPPVVNSIDETWFDKAHTHQPTSCRASKMAPYSLIVHYFWTGLIWFWSKSVHYVGNWRSESTGVLIQHTHIYMVAAIRVLYICAWYILHIKDHRFVEGYSGERANWSQLWCAPN